MSYKNLSKILAEEGLPLEFLVYINNLPDMQAEVSQQTAVLNDYIQRLTENPEEPSVVQENLLNLFRKAVSEKNIEMLHLLLSFLLKPTPNNIDDEITIGSDGKITYRLIDSAQKIVEVTKDLSQIRDMIVQGSLKTFFLLGLATHSGLEELPQKANADSVVDYILSSCAAVEGDARIIVPCAFASSSNMGAIKLRYLTVNKINDRVEISQAFNDTVLFEGVLERPGCKYFTIQQIALNRSVPEPVSSQEMFPIAPEDVKKLLASNVANLSVIKDISEKLLVENYNKTDSGQFDLKDEKKAPRTVINLYDVDGCLCSVDFYEQYKEMMRSEIKRLREDSTEIFDYKQFLQKTEQLLWAANEHLVEEMRGRIKPSDHVVLSSVSTRHSFATDMGNIFKFGAGSYTTSFVVALEGFESILRKVFDQNTIQLHKLVNEYAVPELEPQQYPVGSVFDVLRENHEGIVRAIMAEENHEGNFKKMASIYDKFRDKLKSEHPKVEGFLEDDKTKASIYFQHIHYAVSSAKIRNPTTRIEPITVYDDRDDLLYGGHEFFKANQHLIPKGVTIDFMRYNGQRPPEYIKSDRSGFFSFLGAASEPASNSILRVTGTGPLLTEEQLRACMFSISQEIYGPSGYSEKIFGEKASAFIKKLPAVAPKGKFKLAPLAAPAVMVQEVKSPVVVQASTPIAKPPVAVAPATEPAAIPAPEVLDLIAPAETPLIKVREPINTEAQMRLQAKDSEITELRAQVRTRDNLLRTATIEKDDLAVQLTAIEKRLDDSTQDVQRLQNTLKTKIDAKKTDENTIEILSEEIQGLKDIIEGLKKQNETLREVIDQDTVKREMSLGQQKLQESQEALALREQEVRALTDQLKEYDDAFMLERQAREAVMSQLSEAKSALSLEQQTKEKEIEILTDKLQKSGQSADLNRKTVERLRGNEELKEAILAGVQEQKATALKQLQAAQAEIEALKTQHQQQLQENQQSAKSEPEALKAQYQESTEVQAAAQEAKTDIERAMATLTAQLQEGRHDIEEREERSRVLSSSLQQAQTELQLLKDRFHANAGAEHSLNDQLSKVRAEVARLQEELRKALSDSQAQVRAKEAIIQSSESLRQRNEEKIQALERSLAEVQSRNRQESMNFDGAQEKLLEVQEVLFETNKATRAQEGLVVRLRDKIKWLKSGEMSPVAKVALGIGAVLGNVIGLFAAWISYRAQDRSRKNHAKRCVRQGIDSSVININVNEHFEVTPIPGTGSSLGFWSSWGNTENLPKYELAVEDGMAPSAPRPAK